MMTGLLFLRIPSSFASIPAVSIGTAGQRGQFLVGADSLRQLGPITSTRFDLPGTDRERDERKFSYNPNGRSYKVAAST